MADKLTKQALAAQRKRLKVRLWREREVGLPVPPCDYCNEPMRHPDDCVMHEWLIRRGRLPIAVQYKIMHPYNCSLLHVECHSQYGQTRECKLRCARAMYERYGRNVIAAWVQSLGLKQHVEVPTEEEAFDGGA